MVAGFDGQWLLGGVLRLFLSVSPAGRAHSTFRPVAARPARENTARTGVRVGNEHFTGTWVLAGTGHSRFQIRPLDKIQRRPQLAPSGSTLPGGCILKSGGQADERRGGLGAICLMRGGTSQSLSTVSRSVAFRQSYLVRLLCRSTATTNVLDSVLITAHAAFQSGDDVKAPEYQLPTGTPISG